MSSLLTTQYSVGIIGCRPPIKTSSIFYPSKEYLKEFIKKRFREKHLDPPVLITMDDKTGPYIARTLIESDVPYDAVITSGCSFSQKCKYYLNRAGVVWEIIDPITALDEVGNSCLHYPTFLSEIYRLKFKQSFLRILTRNRWLAAHCKNIIAPAYSFLGRLTPIGICNRCLVIESILNRGMPILTSWWGLSAQQTVKLPGQQITNFLQGESPLTIKKIEGYYVPRSKGCCVYSGRTVEVGFGDGYGCMKRKSQHSSIDDDDVPF